MRHLVATCTVLLAMGGCATGERRTVTACPLVDHEERALAYLELREFDWVREHVELAIAHGSMTARRYGWWRGVLGAVPVYIISEDEWACVLECLATRERARDDDLVGAMLGEQQVARDLRGACAPWRFSGV